MFKTDDDYDCLPNCVGKKTYCLNDYQQICV